MKCFVTGAAGFIGSNLVDRLLDIGDTVTGFDNLSTGFARNLIAPLLREKFNFVTGDILRPEEMISHMFGCDIVFHLAANADVRHGPENIGLDLQQNTIGTFSVLESMKEAGVKTIVFASTASVYGNAQIHPTPEDAPMPIQTSLYGASKLAGEALIQAFCEAFGFQSYIYRLCGVLGPRYSHGHVIDFYRQLKEHPDYLDVLGDGRQRKPYIYVNDVARGMLRGLSQTDRVNIFNLGPNWSVPLAESISFITQKMNVTPQINFKGGERGWIGDEPYIHLDNRKLKKCSWEPLMPLKNAIDITLEYFQENEWILNVR